MLTDALPPVGSSRHTILWNCLLTNEPPPMNRRAYFLFSWIFWEHWLPQEFETAIKKEFVYSYRIFLVDNLLAFPPSYFRF